MLKTFVISLPDASERQDYIRQHLSEHDIEFEFIGAVDGREFDVENHPAHHTFRRRAFFGRDLKGGEVGCLLSHRKCYDKIIEEQIPLTLIFEDDVVLNKDFAAVLNESLQHVQFFDILRFITKPKLLKKPYKKLYQLTASPRTRGSAKNMQEIPDQVGDAKKECDGYYWICKTHGVPGGAYAYLITLDGAKKMRAQMEKNYLPVDTLMGQTWITKARSLILMPGTTSVREELGSMIGDERFDKGRLDVQVWQKILYPFTRAGYKLYETFMKLVQYQ